MNNLEVNENLTMSILDQPPKSNKKRKINLLNSEIEGFSLNLWPAHGTLVFSDEIDWFIKYDKHQKLLVDEIKKMKEEEKE